MTRRRRAILLSLPGGALLAVVLAAPARAQNAQTPPNPPAIGSMLTADTLRDLPVGENVYAVLETTQPEVIADRFNSAGLNAGQPARLSGFFGSWSQTVFHVGDLDVSDPTGTGSSLLFPETFLWGQIDVATGQMPADINTSSLAVTLAPRRPTTTWTGALSGSGAGGSLVASPPDGHPPPVVRLREWAHGTALVSGPVVRDRVGVVAGAAWTRASKFQRESLASTDSNLASGFGHVVFTPAPDRQLRVLGWVQRAEVPSELWSAFREPTATTRDESAHVQSTWEQMTSASVRWRVFGGFTQRSRTDALQSESAAVNRLVEGPIPDLVGAIGDTVVRRWEAGARISPFSKTSSRHVAEIGANVARASATVNQAFAGTVGELIDTTPARVWIYTNPGVGSSRHATTVAAFASDSIAVSAKLKLDASIRFESVRGGAEGGATSVNWLTWLPRAGLRWEFAERKRLAFVTGYSRTAAPLNLDWLAFGDPAAPTGIVAPWSAGPLSQRLAAGALTAPVARVGPGTGGDPSFSGIDPDLGRPYTDEFVIGLEARRGPATRFGLTGIVRREANLMGVVNSGVPITGYARIAVPDAGVDLVDPADDRPLPVYNRLPASFGRDAYLVTNPGQEAATLFALKLTAEASTDRLFVLFGATAAVAEGSSANRGYGPLENDQDRPGELFTDPNAATYAHGRLFNDRAFTIKWTTVYRFPHGFRLGAIARYQDGQPFARMVIVPGLNQGADAIRAYSNGGSRFTYTGTLDLRLQQEFAIGPARLDAIVDLYNLLTRSNEVEEYVVSGSAFRTPTAIEPTPAVHLGFRVTF